MENHLTRVRWAMGLTLLPGHLRAMEDALLANVASRFSLRGLPSHGLAALRWNETLLTEGVLSLEAMTLVMPSGILLDIKGNTRAAPLNLNIPGATLLPVYVHLRTPPENLGGEGDPLACERGGVTCWRWPLELSVEQENPDTLETFRLAEFAKQPDGTWQLSPRFIPPLLCVGSVPFLKQDLSGLRDRLDSYHYQLTQEIAAIYLSGADLVNAKQCLKSVLAMQRWLGNLASEIHPHPFEAYEQLKRFYIDLCFYHNTAPQFAADLYRHEQLGEVFQNILVPLTEELHLNQSRSPYLPFVVKEGIVQATLPSSVREAKEVYLLVQKPHITESISLDGLKLAALSRVPVVHKFYLQGIPYKRLERPPFQHSFGPEVDIYQLLEGEEWDYALRELALGFYAAAEFAEARFFLYWRAV